MIKFILSFAVLLIACVISCTNKNDEILIANDALAPEVVMKWFKSYNKKSNNQRVVRNRFENLEPLWNLAKEQVTNSGAKCLEIPLKYSTETRWISNLGKDGVKELKMSTPKLCMVVYLEKGERVVTIKEIRPSVEYDRKYNGHIQKDSFSGKLFVWNWSGELIGGSFYENGKRLGTIKPVSGDKNGRTSAVVCDVTTECHWSSYCFQFAGPGGAGNPVIIYGTQTYGYNTSCHPPDDYGHHDGMAQCSGWEQTASYTYQQCYNTPDPEEPGDGEGSGPVEVDTFEGFPTNPFDGQVIEYVHASGDKTFFIYNAQFGLWMLPEVTNFKTRGFDIQITAPNQLFTGGILTAYTIPLAVEPTQIGKVVLGGAALIYAGLYIYQQTAFINYLRVNENLEHCIRLYANNCTSGPCDDCLAFCRAQGYWPAHLCRLN